MPFDFDVFVIDMANMASMAFEARKVSILNQMEAEIKMSNSYAEGSFQALNAAILGSYYGKVENAKNRDELNAIMDDCLYECRINYLAYYNHLIGEMLAEKSHRSAYMPAILFPKFTFKEADEIKSVLECASRASGKMIKADETIRAGKISWEAYAIMELQKLAKGLKTFEETDEDYGIIVARLGARLEDYLANKDVIEASEISDILSLLDEIATEIIKERDMKKLGNRLSRIRFRDLEKDRRFVEACS